MTTQVESSIDKVGLLSQSVLAFAEQLEEIANALTVVGNDALAEKLGYITRNLVGIGDALEKTSYKLAEEFINRS